MIIVSLAETEGTVRAFAEKLIRAASLRVKPRGSFKLMSGERALDLDATLQAQGLQPLQRVDLRWE